MVSSTQPPVSLSKLVDWAQQFEEESKKEDSICFIKPSKLPEGPPFEFIKKKNIFVRFTHALKAFFSIHSDSSKVAESVSSVTKTAADLSLFNNKKIGLVFSSVQKFYHYIEDSSSWLERKLVLKGTESKLTDLFAQCILDKIKERFKTIERVSLSDEGALIFLFQDKTQVPEKELFEEFGISDPSLQKETLNKLYAYFHEDADMQKRIMEAIRTLYENKCDAAKTEMDAVLKRHSQGILFSAAQTSKAEKECKEAIHTFEQSYISFVEDCSKFFMTHQNVLTPENMESITTELKKKHGSIWDGLLISKEGNIQRALILNNLYRMNDLVDSVIKGMEGAQNIPEDRAGTVLALLEKIKTDAGRIQKEVHGVKGYENISREASLIMEKCSVAQEKLSASVKTSWWKRDSRTIIINAPITVGNIGPGAMVVIAANTGDIVNKPYVQTAQKAAEVFSSQQSGVLSSVLGNALTVGVGSAIQGLVFGGIPGMVTMGIASATAVLASSIIQVAGDKLGLPRGISTTVGLMTALATSAYASQYVGAYLQGKVISQPGAEGSAAAPPPQAASTEYPAGKEPIGPKQEPERHTSAAPPKAARTGYSSGQEPIGSKQEQLRHKSAAPPPPPVASAKTTAQPAAAAPKQASQQAMHAAPPPPPVEECGRWCRIWKIADRMGNPTLADKVLGAGLGAAAWAATGANPSGNIVTGVGETLLRGAIPLKTMSNPSQGIFV